VCLGGAVSACRVRGPAVQEAVTALLVKIAWRQKHRLEDALRLIELKRRAVGEPEPLEGELAVVELLREVHHALHRGQHEDNAKVRHRFPRALIRAGLRILLIAYRLPLQVGNARTHGAKMCVGLDVLGLASADNFKKEPTARPFISEVDLMYNLI